MFLFLSASQHKKVSELASSQLKSKLDKQTKDSDPLLIESSINLQNILDVAEKEQIISVETTLIMCWKVT